MGTPSGRISMAACSRVIYASCRRLPWVRRAKFDKSHILHINFCMGLFPMGYSMILLSCWLYTVLLRCSIIYNYISNVNITMWIHNKDHDFNSRNGSLDSSTEKWAVQESIFCSLLRDYNFRLSRFLQLKNWAIIVRDRYSNWYWAHEQLLAG